MVYMGAKTKIADYIVPIIQSHIAVSGARTYIEPFCGGCNVIDKIKANNRIAADKNEYLIALFKYLQSGGKLPDAVPKEEYDRVRKDKKVFRRGMLGRSVSLHHSMAGFLMEAMRASGTTEVEEGIISEKTAATF